MTEEKKYTATTENSRVIAISQHLEDWLDKYGLGCQAVGQHGAHFKRTIDPHFTRISLKGSGFELGFEIRETTPTEALRVDNWNLDGAAQVGRAARSIINCRLDNCDFKDRVLVADCKILMPRIELDANLVAERSNLMVLRNFSHGQIIATNCRISGAGDVGFTTKIFAQGCLVVDFGHSNQIDLTDCLVVNCLLTKRLTSIRNCEIYASPDLYNKSLDISGVSRRYLASIPLDKLKPTYLRAIKPALCLGLMHADMESHPKDDAESLFDEWGEQGDCPYTEYSAAREWKFEESQSIWQAGRGVIELCDYCENDCDCDENHGCNCYCDDEEDCKAVASLDKSLMDKKDWQLQQAIIDYGAIGFMVSNDNTRAEVSRVVSQALCAGIGGYHMATNDDENPIVNFLTQEI